MSNTIDIIAYNEYDLDCLAKDNQLRKGSDISKVYGNSNYVLTILDKDNLLDIDDKIQVGDKEIKIAGLLKYDPFSSDGNTNGKVTLITSGETFTRLTGITDYSLVLVQTTKDATDEDVAAIRNMLGENGVFHDRRDQRTTSTYIAFLLFVYGFLAIITLITAHFNYATWSIPVIPLTLILLFVFVATIVAIHTPSKRIRYISVVETINDL